MISWRLKLSIVRRRRPRPWAWIPQTRALRIRSNKSGKPKGTTTPWSKRLRRKSARSKRRLRERLPRPKCWGRIRVVPANLKILKIERNSWISRTPSIIQRSFLKHPNTVGARSISSPLRVDQPREPRKAPTRNLGNRLTSLARRIPNESFCISKGRRLIRTKIKPTSLMTAFQDTLKSPKSTWNRKLKNSLTWPRNIKTNTSMNRAS